MINGTSLYEIVCLSIVFMLSCTMHTSLATIYTVGDSSGWSLGVDYGTWSSDKTFIVGDTLVFSYGSSHTIDEVTETDYSSCSIGNVIATDNSGATNVLLDKPGKRYFVCGIVGHCTGGMKIAVDIKQSTSSSTVDSPPTGVAPNISFSSSVGAMGSPIIVGVVLAFVIGIYCR